jgi:hypothetical protein
MDRSVGKWKLPQPTDLKDEEQKEWIQIPRIARTIPFGYELNENDPDLLDPIPYELEAIELARKYVKQYSYREVANWLTNKTNREISHVGLRKRLMHEPQQKNLENLYLNLRKCILKYGRVLSGQKERCNGKHHQVQDYGCLI